MNDGRFRSDVPRVAGKTVWEANEIVIDWFEREWPFARLQEKWNTQLSTLLASQKPIIFRATAQWFIFMDKVGVEGKVLRDVAMNAVDDTEFFPCLGPCAFGIDDFQVAQTGVCHANAIGVCRWPSLPTKKLANCILRVLSLWKSLPSALSKKA